MGNNIADQHIRVANAPCSWGVLEFDQFAPAVSYTQMLTEIAEAGYAGTELGDWGFMPTDPTVLRGALDERKLELVGGFMQMMLRGDASQRAEGVQQGLKTAHLFADAGYSQAQIVLADQNGSDPHRTAQAGRICGTSLSNAEWSEVATGVVNFSKTIFDATGIRTVFHHHCAGFVETPAEVEKLLSLTTADEFKLCLDMGHYAFAGGYADAACTLFGDRIGHIHYKDCSAEIATASREYQYSYFESVRRGVFCELGTGMVDFRSITDYLRQIDYRGWIVVEQDVLPGNGNPLEYAKRNRSYLQTLGL